MNNSPVIRLAVFDCDGTLVDSLASIVTSVRLAWQAVGLTPPDEAAVRQVVGLQLDEAISRLGPSLNPETAGRIRDAYRDAFFATEIASGQEAPLYPGMREALDSLAAEGWIFGVATGKGRRGLDATLAAHDLGGRFQTLQTSDVAPGKPDPEMLLRAMAECGAEPGGTVMIGDTTFDILMAVNAGVTAIGVGWGYHPEAELSSAGAAEVVRNAADIPGSARRLTNRKGS